MIKTVSSAVGRSKLQGSEPEQQDTGRDERFVPSGHSVDLERREDRYIIFVQDTSELIDALARYTRQLDYPETPVTRTVYFGDKVRGLPPGISIKARTYARDRLLGRWDLNSKSVFQLLELKRTVERQAHSQTVAKKGQSKKGGSLKRKDQMVEILRLSSSLLARSTYKSKRRKPDISLQDLLKFIGTPTKMRKRMDPHLYVHLLETVHPLEDYDWLPLIGTEYERTHFVTRSARMRDVFRATLDRQVTHYSFSTQEKGFVGVPLTTEDFSRFEIKMDQERIAGTQLGKWLEQILVEFRAFRIPSKKYRGLTQRSHYMIQREGLRNEIPEKRLFTQFRSRPVRYKDREHYVNLARYIQSSPTFHLYGGEPQLLENHEHSLCGRHQGLDVVLAGNALTYHRTPTRVQHGKMVLYSADQVPVSQLPIVSRADLDRANIEKIRKRETRYIHERGFLVEHKKSQRVYKVTLERHLRSTSLPRSYVRIEYCGRRNKPPRFDKLDAITREIGLLYRFLRKDPFL